MPCTSRSDSMVKIRPLAGPRRLLAPRANLDYWFSMRHLFWLALPLGTVVSLAQLVGFPGSGGAVVARIYAAPIFGGYGGISYVTRRTPMINANLIAGDYFRGSGVPLINTTAASLNANGNTAGYGGARTTPAAIPYLAQRPNGIPETGAPVATTAARTVLDDRQPASPGRFAADQTTAPVSAATSTPTPAAPANPLPGGNPAR